ncbi:hypothetical protein KSF_107850 [Reticulibacter mediterranei]|uniref:LSDAT prokaryote domain-containing protein n=1 Tax=Reticulibacter mediterranei TaxID=2778369 RepID=A0A8J3J1P9_9CHLR|nr:hypothetical protein [Reticulibacter mediterranei]GHP00738.1 hypothetical protein KSF_107850 [Reticulibacter mediterranei]
MKINAVEHFADISELVSAFQYRPVVNVIGGGLPPAVSNYAAQLCEQAVVPTATACGACLVDGATDDGIMHVLGSAVHQAGSVVPLIGVTVEAKALWNTVDADSSKKRYSLEPHHDQVILTPGTSFGGETAWMQEVIHAITGQTHRSVAVLFSGGAITWREVYASLQNRRPVLVCQGTGRAADTLAAALQGGTIAEGCAPDFLGDLLAAKDLLKIIPNVASLQLALKDALLSS